MLLGLFYGRWLAQELLLSPICFDNITRQAASHDAKVKVLSMCAGQQEAGAGAGGVVARGTMQEGLEEAQLQQLQAMQEALQMS